MPLPHVGMDAVPFTTLPAAFLDNMIENIEYTNSLVEGVPASGTGGWDFLTAGANVSSVAANGNRSYTLTSTGLDFTTLLYSGTRIRTTRTVAAPTRCTSLNGTTQFYSKTSPAGMTFTDDFTVSAWVKLSSYADGGVISRYNGTSGWILEVGTVGTIVLTGFNGGSANFSRIASVQALPLNRWVHIAAQLDMSSFTATPTTSYVMIDGVDVPASVSRGGTNPTALVQAGNLEIGTFNAGAFFPGKIAQAAVYSAKVSQATILASINQTLAGTETSLISAYSFNNTINDLNTTNANNLTANGSAVATTADSPFSLDANGTPGGTYDYGVVQKVATTVVTIQVPEGNTIPTTGGVSSLHFATGGVPYGFPKQSGRWRVLTNLYADTSNVTVAGSTPTNINGFQLRVPVGDWIIAAQAIIGCNGSSAGSITSKIWINQTTTPSTNNAIAMQRAGGAYSSTNNDVTFHRSVPISVGTTTSYTLVYLAEAATGTPSYRNYNAALGVEQSLFYVDLANL